MPKSLLIVSFILFISLSNCSNGNKNIQNLPSEWEFAIGDPNDTVEDVANYDFLPLTNEQKGKLESILPSGIGYIWLRKTFALDINTDQSLVYSISPGRIAWADKTFLNGEMIGRGGEFPPDDWSAWNTIRDYSIAKGLLKKSEQNVLLIKIYVNQEGFVYNEALLGETIELGNHLFLSKFFNSYINAFVAFLFIIISMYHLLIYLKRKKDRENWYYAIFAMFYAIYCTNFFNEFFYNYIGISYLTYQKIIFLVQAGSAYYLLRFFSIFFKNDLNRNLKIFFISVITIPGIISLFFPDYGTLQKFRGLVNIFQILPVLSFIIYSVARGLIRKEKDAKAMVYGLIPMIIAVIHDIGLGILDVKGAIFLAGLGFPIFLGSIMFILASKFVKVQNETDDLNANLEKKVEERTVEVTQRMEEVQKLKVQQDGDYFLTSLIEKPLATNYNKSKLVSTIFHLDQKKKFAFRNKKAELGGDLCISGNLRFGDGKDRWIIFFNADAMGKSMQGAGGAIVAGTAMNNILSRSARDNRVLTVTPEEWISETFFELDSIFKTFNGSMLISCVLGVLNERTGELFYFNAEHPWTVVYRDGKASFIENELTLRKLGSESEFTFKVHKAKIFAGDVLFVGSDGRDDINLSEQGERVINEDETLFLRLVEESRGELDKLVQLIEFQGELTDDLSLIRVGFQEHYSVEEYQEDDQEIVNLESAQEAIQSGNKTKAKYILDSIWEKDRNNLSALKLLVKLYFDDKKYKDTVDRINEFHNFSKDSSLFWFEKSVCYKQLQDFENAKKAGEVCRKYQPERVANLINLADSYRMLGDDENARKILREAMDQEPDNQSAIKLARILSLGV
ncbi:SpoIIE family protein phosphatase [Leptospira sp. GIMC2001]|uniref:SpoIIE family protein phosphatase n=1 Tax=Leptospira sp. GIMC2001 TaxID=1513297 RepID=UPI0023497E66|nr:SpoIIE family protein phosphatase [Leptospira sp. GIMC2001]WCL49211.1 SpoIIE family protein phosphatase [Leptospira sp. GIMC2001]